MFSAAIEIAGADSRFERASYVRVEAFRRLCRVEIAQVDARMGQRSLRGLGTWSQVRAAFDHWGDHFAK